MEDPGPQLPVRDYLPPQALNLARRALQLAEGGNGRHTLELIVSEGRWLLIVDGGPKVEELGGRNTPIDSREAI